MLTDAELKQSALKTLRTKRVQQLRSATCNIFSDKTQKRECNTSFDKSFIVAARRSLKNKKRK